MRSCFIRFKFSLRKLIANTTVFCVLAWIYSYVCMIRERHAVIGGLKDYKSKDVLSAKIGFGPINIPPCETEGVLGLLGEPGVRWITVYCDGADDTKFIRIQRLFPEARVNWMRPATQKVSRRTKN